MDQGTRQLGDAYVAPSSDMGDLIADANTLNDMRVPTAVTDCPSLCTRLSECNRNVLGNQEECLSACESMSQYENFANYLSCVDRAACTQLDSCVLPEPPPPTCEEVCEALEDCDPSPRLPTGFRDISRCDEACEQESIAASMVICGGAIVEGSSTCDSENFSECLADQLYPNCYAVCDRKLMCGASENLIDCVVECASPMGDSDPIMRRRARLRQTCWQTADTCDDARRCDEPTPSPTVDPSALCTADAQCSLIDAPCEETVAEIGPSIGAAALRCVAETIGESCDAPLTQCFMQADLEPLDCDEYCAVAALCEVLPQGQAEFDCVSDCRAAIGNGAPEAINRFRRPTACAYANTCADLSECLAQGADTDLCTSACDHLTLCDAANEAEACNQRCAAANSLREDLFWSCNALVNTCQSAQCSVPPAPNCDTICLGLEGCGLADDNCHRTCDDSAYLEPATFVSRYACHAVARNCPDRDLCENNQFTAGNACVQQCRGDLGCTGDQATLLSCIDRCASGLEGDSGLRFELNYTCLSNLPSDATCADISACNAAPTADAVCASICGATEACGLLDMDEDLTACQAECALNFGSASTTAYACALRAGRIANGCLDLAACLNIEVPPAAPACVTQCEARARCDQTTDQFLCERQCDANQAGTDIRLACLDTYSDCPSIQACLDNPLADDQLCSDICNTLAQCDGQLGPNGRYADLVSCERSCGVEALVNVEIDYAAVGVCLGESDCVDDAIDRCFNGGSAAPTCDNAWTAYEMCDNDTNFLWAFLMPPVTDRASYIAFCSGLIASEGASVIEPRLECVINAAANGMCDQQIGCAF